MLPATFEGLAWLAVGTRPRVGVQVERGPSVIGRDSMKISCLLPYDRDDDMRAISARGAAGAA